MFCSTLAQSTAKLKVYVLPALVGTGKECFMTGTAQSYQNLKEKLIHHVSAGFAEDRTGYFQ